MKIKQIAKALNVSPELVTKRIREVFPNKMKKGKTTILNEQEVTILKLRIEENSHLLTSYDHTKLPKTNLEKKLLIKQALIYQQEEIDALMAENYELKPKAALADAALRDQEKQYSITDAGKHLNIRQKEIFRIMRENKLLTQTNMPSQKAIDYGVLTLRTNVVDEKNRPQAVMTMENIDNFRKRYLNKAIEVIGDK